jgi:hypothetical protein
LLLASSFSWCRGYTLNGGYEYQRRNERKLYTILHTISSFAHDQTDTGFCAITLHPDNPTLSYSTGAEPGLTSEPI